MINNTQFLGIINITPNSFSDGGDFFHADRFIEQWHALQSTMDGIDIGAESTAPMNQAICADQEIERFKNIMFNALARLDSYPRFLSFDTYRAETFRTILSFLDQISIPKIPIFWNDVSGKFDAEVLELLKSRSNIYYVYCHNLSPSRELSGSHMSYVSKASPEEIPGLIAEDFKQVFSALKEQGLEQRVCFDPCFGFSKSRAQNIVLFQRIHELFARCPEISKWFIGISRKSFTRPEVIDEKSLLAASESVQAILLYQLMKENKQKDLIVRLHSSSTVHALEHIFVNFKYE